MKQITKQNAKADKVSHVAEFVGLGSLPIRKTKSYNSYFGGYRLRFLTLLKLTLYTYFQEKQNTHVSEVKKIL